MATPRERKGINVVSNLLSKNIDDINKKTGEKKSFEITEENTSFINIKNEILEHYHFNFEIDNETEQFLKEQTFKLHSVNNKMNTELGKIFKETQDLLSKNRYGCFRAWFEELGFKKDSVYRYIGRYNLIVALGDSKKVEIVEALPIKLAYEISKDDCQEELRNRVLNGEITSLADFMEQKKLKLSQIDEAQVVEESKDYSSILENDFKIFNNNYKALNSSLKDKIKDLTEDKQKSVVEDIESINKKIEKLLSSL
ncbi:MAG: hypothetical protein KBE24_06845 [Fusobacteriaceae bacterium]|jgi:hypothetical protein|nr:hypothetical protein [Fusobacteriaceae bacterium]